MIRIGAAAQRGSGAVKRLKVVRASVCVAEQDEAERRAREHQRSRNRSSLWKTGFQRHFSGNIGRPEKRP